MERLSLFFALQTVPRVRTHSANESGWGILGAVRNAGLRPRLPLVLSRNSNFCTQQAEPSNQASVGARRFWAGAQYGVNNLERIYGKDLLLSDALSKTIESPILLVET